MKLPVFQRPLWLSSGSRQLRQRRSTLAALFAVLAVAVSVPVANAATASATVKLVLLDDLVVVSSKGFPVSAPIKVTATVQGGSGTMATTTNSKGRLLMAFSTPDGFTGAVKVLAVSGSTSANSTISVGDTSSSTSTVSTATTIKTSGSSTTTKPTIPQATTTTTTKATVPSTSSTVPTTSGGAGNKVLVIVDENHSAAQVAKGMPYYTSLAGTYGKTTAYKGITHPSEPNYMAIAGGSTFGIKDDAAPSANSVSGQSVFGAAIANGKTAKAYNDAMASNCVTTGKVGTYAVKHNPWPYFKDEAALCKKFDLPLSALGSDISSGSLPNVGMLTPDMCNDSHDCSLATGDAFLKTWIPKLMAGPDYKSGKLTIVLTFDEDDGGAGNLVQTVLLNESVKGKSVGTSLNHYSLSRWLYRVGGGTPQKEAAKATDLGTAFGL